MRHKIGLAVFALLLSVPAWSMATGGMDEQRVPPPPMPAIATLTLEPATLTLNDSRDERRILVIGKTSTGALIDLTSIAVLKSTSPNIEITLEGYIVPKIPGEAKVVVSAAGKEAQLSVTVKSAVVEKIRFVRDVLPVLGRAGCNAGACHGAAQGKNGFKLSLRGYDPEYDYQSLINDISGRRFNRVDPAQSLMLLKPTAMVAHEGKEVFKVGSRYYNLLLQWIAEGIQDEEAVKGRATALEVLPATVDFDLPGRTQQIVVLAKFADGSLRDVTRESIYSTSNKDVATVKNNVVSAERRGESAILVRYEGLYTSRQVTVMGNRTGFVWKDAPTNNYIDKHVLTKLKAMQIEPSELCTDADFLRRVSLDLTGLPPTPEKARAFITDTAADKREKLIDELIGSEEYIACWSNKWADLLQCNGKALGEKGVWVFREWIRNAIADNQPYDAFVRELLTAKGSSFKNPAVNYMRVLREPGKMTEDVSQTFLGVRFNCNKCHDHPFEKWTQAQYYQFGAFFARVNFKKGQTEGEEIVYRSYKGEVKHPKSDKDVTPTVPFGTSKDTATEDDRREPFVEWMTSRENPIFAKSTANRVWSYFFGIGIIDPVDDIRASNPASNAALLDALGEQFVKNNFDMRKLIRDICTSRTYQLSIKTNKWNIDDTTNFSHFIPRRLGAEQMLDAVAVATGVRPKMPGMPDNMRAVDLPDGMITGNDFLTLFGRPGRESSCECERTNNISLPHTLNLINGAMIGDALIGNGRLQKMILAEKDDKKVVEMIYLSILCRMPTEKELVDMQLGANRLEGAQDLAWALMNSPAFIFNR